jgi:ribulose-phosphate 3-epimerase
MKSDRLLRDLLSETPLIAPSLLTCDFGRLSEEVRAVERAGARILHLDVMDGHFVPNLTYGAVVARAVRQATKLPIDVHLMVTNPEQHLEAFAEAGCDSLTFHIEAVPEPRPLLEKIRSRGLLAGITLNPPTPLERVTGCLDACDQVLVMSVDPGFGGQSFQPIALEKLRALQSLVGPEVLLAVDGGINRQTIEAAAQAGARMFIVGSAIFRAADYSVELADLLRRARNPLSGAPASA